MVYVTIKIIMNQDIIILYNRVFCHWNGKGKIKQAIGDLL